MKVWIDAQLSPRLAPWLHSTFSVEAKPVRELGLRDAPDEKIFMAARAEDAVVMTKDVDFVDLLRHHGPPPRILWITCGNTSNEALQKILSRAWKSAAAHFEHGDSLVEIR